MNTGGAETIVRDLALFFESKGWRVTIVTLFKNNININLNRQVEIYSLEISRNPLSLVSAFRNYRKLLHSIEPEIVHAHLFYSILFTRIVRIILKIRILVGTLHSSKETYYLNYLFLRMTNFMGDLLTTVSTFAASELERNFVSTHNSIVVIPNGIDTKKFRPGKSLDEFIETNSLKFITVGRLTRYKNHHNLIIAFSRIARKYPRATLTIIGDGEERTPLTDLVSEYGLCKNVYLRGHSTDVAEYLNDSDFYVHASLWEGFGLVLAEAMSSELVVISTNFDVAFEVMGDCGIYTNGFTSEDLFQSLDFACSLSIIDRRGLGLKARKRVVNRFDISSMYLNYEELYLRLINEI